MSDDDELDAIFDGMSFGEFNIEQIAGKDVNLDDVFSSKDIMRHDAHEEIYSSAFDEITADYTGAPKQFLQAMFRNLSEDWRKTGLSTYVCILSWGNCVDSDDVNKFRSALSSCYSRCKGGAGRDLVLPKLVKGKHKNMADCRKVLFEMHLMNDSQWRAFNTKERAHRANSKTTSKQSALTASLVELFTGPFLESD
jgi:hypothetical protein